MKIDLLTYGGEFCTERTSPAILPLKRLFREAILLNEPLVVSTLGVRIITPAFVDELLPELIIELGREAVELNIKFDPPLSGFAFEQIERGVRNRKSSKI